MICNNCKSETRIVRKRGDQEYCPNCSGLKQNGKTRPDGVLTRSSFRIRSESSKNEGDMITPHFYNKEKRAMDINPDFIKKYPGQAKEFFNREELDKAGYKKLDISKSSTKEEKAQTQGDSQKAIKNILGE